MSRCYAMDLFIENDFLIKNENFSKAASTYDHYASVQNLGYMFLRSMIQGNPKRILDVGCGTGFQSYYLATDYAHSIVDAFDKSLSMIVYAKSNWFRENLKFFVSDLMSFSSNYPYDLIISNAVFQWIPIHLWRDVLTILLGLLSQRGSLLMSWMGPMTFYELVEGMRFILPERIKIPSEIFPNFDHFFDVLPIHAKVMNNTEKKYIQSFKDVKSLLKMMHFTGVTRRPSRQINWIWTKGHLNNLDQWFFDVYRGVRVTFHYYFSHVIFR